MSLILEVESILRRYKEAIDGCNTMIENLQERRKVARNLSDTESLIHLSKELAISYAQRQAYIQFETDIDDLKDAIEHELAKFNRVGGSE